MSLACNSQLPIYGQVQSTWKMHGKPQFLIIFILLVNLELDFPVCFYNGMDIVKTGLQFAFPIYIWSIVIFIILASRCSTRVSRLTSWSSVQVLATLIHLSYSKLLSSWYPGLQDSRAWHEHFDDNVHYLTDGHVVLFILALLTLFNAYYKPIMLS